MEKSNLNKALVQAFEKGYVVDKDGNVYFNGKKRSLIFDTKGYYTFTIRVVIEDKKVCRRIYVHRLQAYQKFKDKIFESGIEVRHLNGIRTDNSFDNFALGTPSQNQMDRLPEDRIRCAINASYKNRRFTDEELKLINVDKENGMTYKKLCEKYKTSKGTLSFIFNKALYNKK